MRVCEMGRCTLQGKQDSHKDRGEEERLRICLQEFREVSDQNLMCDQVVEALDMMFDHG